MDTPCDVVEDYNHYTRLHVVQGLQIFFSVISIIVVVYTAFRYLISSIFERAFKGLLVTVRLTSVDPCQAQISKLLCYSLRLSSSVPISAFVWVHLGITAQHAISVQTNERAGESRRVRLNLASLFRIHDSLQFVYPAVQIYLGFGSENFEGRVPYCTGATAGSAQTSQYNLILLFTLDILNLVLDFLILRYNQYKLKFDKSFQLLITFRRRQNVYAIKEFLPSAIFHCVCYMAQVFLMFYGRTFRGKVSDIEYNTINAYTYLMPYYCAIGPIILLILMKKGRLIRKEKLKNTVVPQSDETND
ncbi:hypothetical protein PENTCL1PPCAC_3765, partial [Pristionchus entomophagus]